ncbi:MAG: hypothetical protein ACHREM_03960 [Polyangiales bacterium]
MAAKTVFFAWQSWRSPDTTRNVIEAALTSALTQLGRGIGEPLLLDRDTAGVPGAPHVLETIREKILASSAFVADITPVTRLTVEGREDEVPNPNVMLETGLAVSARGWARCVLVFNSALGDTRLLPFDLDKRRVIRFELHDLRDGEDEEQFQHRRKVARDKLSGDLFAALGAILDTGKAHHDAGLVDICGSIFRGRVERVDGDEWTCTLVAPMTPQDMDVVALAHVFESATRRYVSLSRPGVARELAGVPSLERRDSGVTATLRVLPPINRTPAQAIGRDLDLNLEALKGPLKGLTAGGVVDIPRKLKHVLSVRRGEWFLNRELGSLIAEYTSDFDYQTLPELIAIEIARLAFVPTGGRDNVPTLRFVNKVISVSLPEARPDGDWLAVKLDLDIEGVGPWSGTVEVFVKAKAE